MDKKKNNIVKTIAGITYAKATNKATDKISEEIIKMGIKFAKEHIGTTLYFDSMKMYTIRCVQNWLILKDRKKYYKNATNVYKHQIYTDNYDSIDESMEFPLLLDDSKYIIKLEEATYCIVINEYKSRSDI
jgi:hypothetical protein